VPISALEGDNVVDRRKRMPWYHGPTLLEHLETVPLPEKDSLQSFRFPVQTVIRPDATFRGFAGRIASGVIHPGDPVVALPSGQRTSVRSIVTFDAELAQASSSMSVTLQLDDEIDLSRGDMLVSPDDPATVSRKFHARVVWLYGAPLELGKTYLVKHTVRQTKIRALHICHRVDVNTLAERPATQLHMNEIGSVEFETHVPLFFDPYSINRTTGSFILIDFATNATVGAGMIQQDPPAAAIARENEFTPHDSRESPVTPQERYARHGHFPAVLLLEGRPALAARLERQLFERGFEVLHMGPPEFSGDSSADTFRLTQKAGILVLYSGEALSTETKLRLAAEFRERFFDLSHTHEIVSNEERATQHILALAESLRLVDGPRKNQGRVN
jgi:bifunctional enzyme CysN/CysC